MSRHPLSPTQRDLYLDQLIHPKATTYSLGLSLELGEGVDEIRWRDAVCAVAVEEEALQARFVADGGDGEPAQLLGPAGDPTHELIVLGEGDLETLADVIARRVKVPYDLLHGPLCRSFLVRDPSGVYTAVLAVHHAVCDAFSGRLFFERVSAAYEALSVGGAPPLRRGPCFHESLAVSRARCDTPAVESYWRERCSGMAPLTPPAAGPHGPTGSGPVAAKAVIAGAELAALRAFCAARGWSLAAWWRSLYAVLLGRYFDVEQRYALFDVAAGRPAEHAATIGCFYQVVPLVVEHELLQAGTPITAAVEALQAARREVGERRHVSALLQKRLLPPGGVRFFYNYYHFAVTRVLGRDAVLRVHDSFPSDEVHLIISDHRGRDGGDELELAIYADRGAFADDAMLDRLLRLSRQAIAGDDGEVTLGDLDLTLPSERRQLAAWNATGWAWSGPADLRSLLVAQVACTQDAVAASCAGQALSYGELHRRAASVADELGRAGVGADGVVGIFLERSLELMVALVGVIRAGAAWLPLDPDYPAERLAGMLADAAADDDAPPVVLTRAAWRDRVPGRARCQAIPEVEEGCQAILEGVPGRARCQAIPEVEEGCQAILEAGEPTVIDGDQLAYVIFTSGSTGRPKGAMNSHRAIVNRLLWMQEAYGLDGSDRVLQKTPISFDVSVWELLWPLMTGAELVLARPGEHRDPAALVKTVRRRRVTTLHFVPAMLRLFLAEPEAGACTSLRRVIASGEALTPELRDAFCARLDAELHNLYGPTEAAVDVTAWDCRVAAEDRSAASVPIGAPIANVRAQVRDRWGKLVPVGMAGELLLGGVALARGYYRRPALTAARFVPDPAGGEWGGRLYRTGDLARWRGDGALEYLGRIDHQVKVRGVRVELGEIEAALRRSPGVAAAVVTASERLPGDVRLTAYVVASGVASGVAAGETAPDAAALRRGLERTLPDAMVPASFVFLTELPLTPSGKVDRRALPDPTPEAAGDRPYAAPRNATEKVVAAELAALLGVPRVSVDDDVFALGTHSLLLAQLAARLRQRLGVELELAAAFQLPTVAALAAHLAADEAGARAAIPPLVPASRTGDLRLSFAQERVWFLHQLDPESLAYNVQFLLHFDGPLRPDLLAAALSEVVRRHEILRTSFPARGGRPVQEIHAPFPVELPLVDLRALPAARRDGALRRAVRRAITVPFDVRRLPLARWLLCRRGEEGFTLLQIEHHFVHDGWSVAVILSELRAIYTALVTGAIRPGEPAPLPAPGAQYADFVAWQRGWIQGEVLAAQLGYWTAQLQGAPPFLELPADRPRPAAWSFRGDALIERLPADLYAALRTFSRKQGVTLFVVMAAALNALLARFTGERDLPLGSGFANRRLRELETMLGMVVNSVVLRTDLSGDPTFGEVMRRTRRVILDAHTHQDLPFEKLVEGLQPARDPAYNPLFQVLFGFHDSPVPDLDWADLTGRFEPLHNRSAKTDLNIVVIPRREQRLGREVGSEPEEMFLVWEFGSDLFDRSTMERTYRSYLTLLRGVVEAPATRLADLPLLTPEEERQLVGEWNDTATRYPRGASVPELFAAQAARTPDALAVDFADARWSYGELAQVADRLARRLRRLGVGPETRVAVSLPRSAERLAVFLAVLTAGGAYVPLDPADPPERLAFLLADSRAPLVVTRGDVAAALPEIAGVRVLRLEDVDLQEGAEGVDAASTAPLPAPHPDALAYVIYTSGSTGRPKGVAVPHRGIVRLVRDTDYLQVLPGDRVAQLSNAAFDAATFEIWGALLNGAAVVGADDDVLLAPAELARTLEEGGVTVLFLTTAVFNQVAREQPTAFRNLRCLLFGGEACDPRRVREVLAAGGPGRLLHVYGPTEGTTFSSWHPVAEVAPGAVTVPIGRPLANASLHVVDGRGRPVPLGVAGELVIGGDGLARGYVADPARTAARFVPDPWGDGSLPGARLYRSGDRVRRLVGGAVEFLGRDDQQVKLRGFRVELGEIEARLEEHPAVRAAVVVSRRAESGDQQLVAYVVPQEGAAALVDGLAEHLRERLPRYMVPACFVALKRLPLTPSGKIDRRALPAPELSAAAERRVTAPRSAAEKVLAEVWREVLGPEVLGGEVLGLGERELDVDDDFFALGGHSLLATRVVSQLRRLFDLELPLRALFEAPTIAGLARQVESAAWSRPAPPIERADPASLPADGPPLSFAQQRLWFLDRLVPDNPFYNLPFAWQLHGVLDVVALGRALDEVVRRHAVLRTRFPERLGRPALAVAPPAPLALPQIDLAGLPEPCRAEEAKRLTSAELRRPIRVASEAPLRAALLRLGERASVLLLTLHHIVADGWSVGVLLRELQALYAAAEAGQESAGTLSGQESAGTLSGQESAGTLSGTLPELAVSYADFALWQRRWLSGEVLARQLEYWRRRLAGAQPLELPTDRPRPAVQTFRGRRLECRLGRGVAAALEELGQRRHATLFMTLLAGFQTLLHRLTGQRDLVVGSPIANRNRAEVEELIGFFVNSLPMRADLGGDPPFSELLAQLRETALGAYAHQDLPFEKLVEELQPERDLGRNPIFQVMFALQSAPTPELKMGSLALARQPFEARVTRFDLEAQLWNEADGLRIVLYYDLDLFDHTTVLRLERSFRALLSGVSRDPELRLSELPLLDAAESHQLRCEWSAGAPAAAAGLLDRRPVHERVARFAAADPKAEAAVYAWERLSYAELDRRGNQLAHHLRRLGVGAETPVALVMEPCTEMVWGILGVLKAGGAYLPLDPSYPRERLEYTLADARPAAVLTLSAEAGSAALASWTGPVLSLDVAFELDAEGDDAPAVTVGPEYLAYVIYTSGSTGRPKGVAVTHGGLANLVDWHRAAYHVGPGDRMTQVAGPGFDAAVWEVWACLGNGAALYVADGETRAEPHQLVEWLAAEEIDTAFLPTPLAEAALRERWPKGRFRALLTGGDRLHRAAAARATVPLFNQYGPTENAVVATAGAVVPDGVADPPIGRPIAGVQGYLLDRRLRPVPAGAFGELCLAGASLARGYLRRPALTAAAFVPDPLAESPGTRLYRTGDLARHLGDGQISFKGRRDHQVKVRGYRIELGEIEAVLAEHPAVAAAVAVVHAEPSPAGEAPLHRLTAYVVADPVYAGAGDGDREPAADVDERTAEWQREQLAQWEMIFDDLYGRDEAPADPSFNTVGWNDTATGEPIPAAEMSEWLEDAVRSILALRPRRAAEIGCGTGMILFQVAPHCERYLGTDVSAQVLADLERRRGLDPAQGRLPEQVELRQATADAVAFASGEVDTVIFNSVVQYFPSADYLAEVLTRVVASVADGGAVFLGDLRSLPLLAAFHDHVALTQAEDDWPASLLLQRARARQLREDELAVAPAFFYALAERLPRIVRVEVFPKRGRACNELTAFRYQVVLHVGAAAAAEPRPLQWDPWEEDGWSLERLRRRLAEAPAELGFAGVPNARLRRARAIRELAEGDPATVGEVRQRLEGSVPALAGVEPEELWALAAAAGYEVAWSWAQHDAEGCFDVVLRRTGARSPENGAAIDWPRPPLARAEEGWGAYANRPLAGRFARQVIPELRAFLGRRLPDHMVPSSYLLLDELPLTPNGKVDRRALPAPDPERRELAASYVAPRTPEERALAAIWSEVLGRERVGAEDDFFDLGGHSLLATQVVSQARRAFGVELPLAALFASPTVAGLARQVEELAAAAAPGQGAETAAAIPPRVRQSGEGAEELPLSFAQQRLWFLDRLAPDNAFYNIPVAWSFAGALAVPVLAAALQEVVRRHEALRTRFVVRDGEPRQQIVAGRTQALPVVDLQGLAAPARERELARLVNAEAVRTFDLGCDALLRTTLIRLAAAEAALLLTLHHIVADGWSLGVLLRELRALYPAFQAGRPSPLPELPVQYADFALWQRRWLSGAVLERQLGFWREQLRGAAALELPTDRPRPAVQTFRGRRNESRLAPRLLTGVRALGRQHDATLFMTLLAAFDALLYRYTGQGDLVVGSPIANRNRAEIEGMIGFFVNSLALRARLRRATPFSGLLAQVRDTALAAYAHQDLPFEMLVEALQPARDLSRNPIFQVSFGLHSAPMPELGLGDLVVRQLPWELRTTRFDLELHLWESDDGVRCVISYDRDLFDGVTVERLRRHFAALIEGAVAEPERSVGEIPLLDPAARHQLLLAWNEGPEIGSVLVPELFARRAASSPEAVALELAALALDGGHGHELLTYGALERRTNRLAPRLAALGVGPETQVAVWMTRSFELVTAVLAVLKAGGAYVPIDPATPARRLEHVLRHAAPRVVLTERSLADRLPEGPAEVVVVDGEEPTDGIAAPLPLRTAAEQLAYVIYTSGSTGRPKGVAVSHGALAHYLGWALERYPAATGRGVPLHSSLAFDLAVTSLFLPLLAGGRVVLVPEDRGVDALAAALRRMDGAGFVKLTPAHLTLFAQLPGAAAVGRRTGPLVVGGEALPAETVRRWRRLVPGAVLLNEYGPTEAAVGCALFRVDRTSDGVWATLPSAGVAIGRAIAGTRLDVLDTVFDTVPAGVAGELFVAGPGLARGYHRAPAATAERFLPDPFAAAPGERTYRTGDRARRLASGDLEFLGRVDDQVKVRGWRIEPGEIERVLEEHPAVSAAAVRLWEGDDRAGGEGDRRLGAYVVCDAAAAEAPRAAQDDQLARWRTVFDEVYAGAEAEDPGCDRGFDISGWSSAVTGEAIPAEEMREWVDDTVRSIAALAPRRVLEIGCGTGLLLLRLAPGCERYLGIDFSAAALAGLTAEVERRGLSQVELVRAPAAEVGRVAEGGGFDVVVVNSVAQYFPSADYLARVIADAAGAVADGGFIFLGDLRSLPLLPAFHLEVQLQRAADAVPLAELRRSVRREEFAEEELVIDPSFFAALQELLPRVRRVEIFPKGGRSVNELTRYRYQAVLHVGSVGAEADALAPPASWLDWQREGLNLTELVRTLREDAPAAVALTRVPNARLAEVRRAQALLEQDGLSTVGDLRRALALTAGEEREGAVDPAALLALAEELPYTVDLSWAHQDDGSFDAVLRRRAGGGVRLGSFSPPAPRSGLAGLPLSALATDPLRSQLAHRLVPELRAFLHERLPEAMVPASFTLLDALPLAASGKVDRRALPAPEAALPGRGDGYVAPRNPIEEALVGVWTRVLGRAGEELRIGVLDNFFTLGGHSLLATQVISQIRRDFGLELPLRAVFEAPTVAALAHRLSSAGERHPAPPLRPRRRGEGSAAGELPLSFAQQRLWFIDSLAPGNPFYNCPMTWMLRGPLDRPALIRALDAVVQRHEVLRTRFPSRDGRPAQVIAPRLTLAVPVVDLRSLPSAARRARLQQLIDAEAQTPFDLAAGPVIRASLVRLAEEETALLLTLHHIAFDGWSGGVLLRELTAAYRAFVAGSKTSAGLPELPELPVQYADFALWQRRWLRGEVLEEQLAHWRRELAAGGRGGGGVWGEERASGRRELAAAPPLRLPYDRPRPAVQAFRGERQELRLSAEVAHGVAELARAHGATLFMTVLAAFGTLLYRLSGQGDLVVGSPIANRNRSETEGLIGFFVNSLALRLRLAGSLSFRDLLTRVREQALEAYRHQDLPFEKLVEHLHPERDLSRNPIFQVVLAVQNAPRAALAAAGLEIEPLPFETRTARFDLETHLVERPDGLAGVTYFDRDLFDAATVRRWHGHFHLLLAGAVAAPDRRLGDLPLLAASELRQLLVEVNDTARPLAGESVVELFAVAAASAPSRPAVIDGDTVLTYRELDREAERLARRLVRLGVGQESVVALCLERSAAFVRAVLGVLKAGGAYLPLDPSHPDERLAFMLRDAGPRVLLTAGPARPALAGDWRVLDVQGRDLQGREVDDTDLTPVDRRHDPDQLAYVIYTSGSTGRPKGVELRHRGLANLAAWYRRYFAVQPGERSTHLSGVGFDAAVFEIWPCLTAGGTLCLVPAAARSSAPELLAWLAAAAIDRCWLPTPLAELAAQERWPAGLELKALQTAGEQLHRGALGRGALGRGDLGRGVPAPFFNLYGPTETTIMATFAPVGEGDADPAIGRPMDNAQVYLLDARLNPVAPGAFGEICVGGTGVARGYRRRPAATAERFVPDPFADASAGSAARLYRTGDLGRWNAAGELEFCGRIDQQVKVRGYRLELGEVEAVLARHPAVRAAAVAANDLAGERRLVAYVVPDAEYRPPAQASSPTPTAPAGDPVAEWRTLFDDVYAQPAPYAGDAAFNTSGWNSTATGEPIPAAEMRRWLDDTVGRIHDLAPRRVLEIGCGTGLVLFAVAPLCERYLGTDISQPALDYVERQRRAVPGGMPQLSLDRRPATDFAGLAPASFDLVVLNSVVQYFPDADYLAEVLAGALAVVAPGGALFLGDVRSRPLGEAFHAWVELERAGDGEDLAEVVRRARRGLLAEEELLVEPAFFAALRRRLPRLSRIEVFPKRGTATNELTAFRYQVVLHVDGPVSEGTVVTTPPAGDRLDWEREGLGLAELRRRLVEKTPASLTLTGVPNARLAPALRALARTAAGGDSTVDALRRELAGEPSGVDPQALWELARDLPYDVELGWARHGADGRFDAVLARRGSGGRPELPEPVDDPARPLAAYTNAPRFAGRLLPELRRFLAAELPEHMLPSAWLLLPELPLTTSGKVDRRALPAPAEAQLGAAAAYTAPRTPVEERVAEIWRELLGVARVGVDDDFFALGGHSLLATQVASRLRDAYAIEMPLSRLFEKVTLAALAEEVEARRWAVSPARDGATEESRVEEVEEIVL